VLAAVGQGYHHQFTTELDSHLEKVRAEAIDPNPLTNNPSLFHRLSAIASDIGDHVGTDQEGYQDWYLTIKKEFTEKATKAAAAEVDEKWLHWKAKQIDRLAEDFKKEIADHTRSEDISYFIETGERLGLQIMHGGNSSTTVPTPTIGRKCSLSGSFSNAGTKTPTIKGFTPLLAGHTPSLTATPCARPALLHTIQRANTPPPPPNPKVTPTKAQVTNGGLNLDTILAAIEATMGPAIQSVMAPYAAKINVLEKATLPLPQVTQREPRRIMALSPKKPTGTGASMWAPAEQVQPITERGPANTPAPGDTEDFSFTPVARKEWGKNKAGPTPASYAGTAAGAANTKQPPAPARQPIWVPTITEVTVIRSGGFIDSELEQSVRARAADAIVHEVTLKMVKVVARPVPLKAG